MEKWSEDAVNVELFLDLFLNISNRGGEYQERI